VKSQSSSKHPRNTENYLAGASLCCFFSGVWLITESLPILPGRWLGLLAASLLLMSVLLIGILWTGKYSALPNPLPPLHRASQPEIRSTEGPDRRRSGLSPSASIANPVP